MKSPFIFFPPLLTFPSHQLAHAPTAAGFFFLPCGCRLTPGALRLGQRHCRGFDLGQVEKSSAAVRAVAPPPRKLENTTASIGAGGAAREEKRAGGSVCSLRNSSNHIMALLKGDFFLFSFGELTDAAV